MLKKLLFVAVIAAGGAVQSANATVLTFTPQTQSVAQGGSVSVDAVLSGLTSANQILSAFDVKVNFDSSVLGFTSGSFGTDFGFAFPLVSFAVTGSGSTSTVDFGLTSLELDSTLQGIQGDSVTLGTLTFDALAAGTSPLSYSSVDLTGANAQALVPTTIDSGSVNVTNPVPEPPTLLLLGVGALGMVWTRRGRRGRAG